MKEENKSEQPHFKVTLKDVYCKVEEYQDKSEEWRSELKDELREMRNHIAIHNAVKEKVERIDQRCKYNLFENDGYYKKMEKELRDANKKVENLLKLEPVVQEVDKIKGDIGELSRLSTVKTDVEEIKDKVSSLEEQNIIEASHGEGKSAVEGMLLRWLPAIVGVGSLIIAYLSLTNGNG